jgi:hypothetical protein
MTKIILFFSTGGFYYNEDFECITIPWKHHHFDAQVETTTKPEQHETTVTSRHTIVCDTPLSFVNAQGGVTKSKRKPSEDGKYRYTLWVKKWSLREFLYSIKLVYNGVYPLKMLTAKRAMVDGEPMYFYTT